RTIRKIIRTISVYLVRARFGDRIYQSAGRSAELRREISIEHLELADCVLAVFKRHLKLSARQTAPGLIRVNAIHQSIAVEMVGAGEVGRRTCIAVAKLGGTRNHHAEVHELASIERKVLHKSSVDHCAGLLPVRVNQWRSGFDADGLDCGSPS